MAGIGWLRRPVPAVTAGDAATVLPAAAEPGRPGAELQLPVRGGLNINSH